MKSKYYLQKKIFTYYSIVIITIIISSFIAFYIFGYKTLEKNAINNLSNVTQINCSQLDTLFGDMDKIALQIIANPIIIDSFAKAKKSNSLNNYFEEHIIDRYQVISTLTSINGPNIFASRISLYNNQDDYINMGIYPDSYSFINNKLKDKSFSKWYEYIMSFDGRRKMFLPQVDKWSTNKELVLFSLVRELKDLNFSYGIVEIQMPYEKIADICTGYNVSENLNTYVISSEGEIVYPFKRIYTEEDYQLFKFYKKSIGDHTRGFMKVTNPITNSKEIIAYDTSTLSGWTLFYAQPLKDFLFPIRLMGIILIGVGILLIISSLLLIFFITNHLTKPLKDLRKSINEVSLKNLSIDVSNTHYNNELKQLSESFLHMFKRLEASMDEVVHLKTNEMKAHVLALQSQMNPHFLYNTLAVINASAIENDSIKICNMCYKLSNMLRYTSTFSEGLVIIKDELINANNYLDLMKERFEDSLSYTIKTYNDPLHIKVPKLILQPIIENCFNHGLKNKRPPWIIDIVITLDDHHWMMEVYDNGTGFDSKRLESIMKKLDEFYVSPSHNMNDIHIGGLALLNTLIRLKFTYKERMLFDVISNKDYGTKIKIGGPIHD